jgi:hypothetical protein
MKVDIILKLRRQVFLIHIRWHTHKISAILWQISSRGVALALRTYLAVHKNDGLRVLIIHGVLRQVSSIIIVGGDYLLDCGLCELLGFQVERGPPSGLSHQV